MITYNPGQLLFKQILFTVERLTRAVSKRIYLALDMENGMKLGVAEFLDQPPAHKKELRV